MTVPIDLLQVNPSALVDGINAVWVLVVSFLIFFMQPGFALLEAGQVRTKNVSNVLMKNMTDWILGVLVYFVLGSGVATIVGALTSGGSAAGAFAYVNSPGMWVTWLFGAVFAMTAATIVSGAVAERMNFLAYVAFTALMTGLMYPAVVGFTWGGGLLSAGGFLGQAVGAGYQDFAGATVVHMVGGVAGLVAAKMVGPREGRYDSSGETHPIPGHSIMLAVLGTLILAFGWYGFNVGTSGIIGSDGTFLGEQLGRVALNTTLAMGAGGMAAMLVSAIWQGKPDPLWTANGLLAGLVAITGACVHVTWWGGILTGILGGALVLPAYRFTVDTLRVDDVCGVFAVHGAAGAVGTALIPIWAVSGDGAAMGTQLAIQVAGVLVIAAWTVGVSALFLWAIDAVVGLRVTEEEEEVGLDRGEHGVETYPEFIPDSGETTVGAESVADGGVPTSVGDTGGPGDD
ncbi:MAG: ammonium transporter [Haloarculaceae archaeon]